MNKILSKEQLTVYNAIKNFIEENGYSPTIRELCDKTGKRSTRTISEHLFKLKKYGYIDYIKGSNRTIKIVNNNAIKSIQDLNSCIFDAKPIDVIKTELKEKDKEIKRLNNIINELNECYIKVINKCNWIVDHRYYMTEIAIKKSAEEIKNICKYYVKAEWYDTKELKEGE